MGAAAGAALGGSAGRGLTDLISGTEEQAQVYDQVGVVVQEGEGEIGVFGALDLIDDVQGKGPTDREQTKTCKGGRCGIFCRVWCSLKHQELMSISSEHSGYATPAHRPTR